MPPRLPSGGKEAKSPPLLGPRVIHAPLGAACSDRAGFTSHGLARTGPTASAPHRRRYASSPALICRPSSSALAAVVSDWPLIYISFRSLTIVCSFLRLFFRVGGGGGFAGRSSRPSDSPPDAERLRSGSHRGRAVVASSRPRPLRPAPPPPASHSLVFSPGAYAHLVPVLTPAVCSALSTVSFCAALRALFFPSTHPRPHSS